MKYFFALSFISLLSFSCSREGTGGKANVIVYPSHHAAPIINHVGYPDTVYVKFNTTDLPGTKPSDFDVYFVGDPRTDYINCTNLKWGDYYFYVAGFDSSIMSRVIGGAHIKIRQRDKRSIQNANISVLE